MPGKYRISAELTLSSEAEPDGRIGGIEDAERVLDYGDTSSWDRQPVTCSGGEVSFEIAAVDEDDARDIGEGILGNAYYSGDGYFEWEIEDYSITEIEELIPPMDLERALTMIRAFLTRMREMGGVTADEEEAFRFLLDTITP